MYRFQMQCPYCKAICSGYDPPESYSLNDAILCRHCGEIATLKEDFMLEKHTEEDMARWMCGNPISWERAEMMAAEFKRERQARGRES